MQGLFQVDESSEEDQNPNIDEIDGQDPDAFFQENDLPLVTKLSLIEECTNEMDDTNQNIKSTRSLAGLDLSTVQSEGIVAKHNTIPADIVVKESEIAKFTQRINDRLQFFKPLDTKDITVKFQALGQPSKLNTLRRELEILKKLLKDANDRQTQINKETFSLMRGDQTIWVPKVLCIMS